MNDPALGLGVETVVVVAVEAAERRFVILGLELDRAHPPEVGTYCLDLADEGGALGGVGREPRPLSGRSSPLFQKPRQSSSPSAVAIGAKLVSPPLFQFMYSRSRYSPSGTTDGKVAELDPAPLAEHVEARVRRVERDLARPVPGVDVWDSIMTVAVKQLGVVHADARRRISRRADGASIVNISSAAVMRGVPGIDAYTAAKGAMNA